MAVLNPGLCRFNFHFGPDGDKPQVYYSSLYCNRTRLKAMSLFTPPKTARPKLIYVWKTARFGYLNQKLSSFFKPPSKISASTFSPFLTTKS
jgi:hypothetical protein